MELDRKRRILFIGEASFLATGFSTYWHEVLKRLHKTGELEIAEMGSYAHDDDKRCQQVPWKFYPVGPAKSNQKAMQEYMSNPTNQFGEGKFDDVCLEFKPDIVCVPPGTKIETPDGIKNIEKIRKGESVISHTGKSRKVLATMKRQHVGTVVKIQVCNDNQYYTFTPGHPVLAIQSKKRTWKRRDVKDRHSIRDARFIEADKLSQGDYVLIPIYRPAKEHLGIIDITDYLDQFIFDKENQRIYPNGHKDYGRDNSLPKYINVTKDFARLLGYYVAEGSCSRGQIQFTFGITPSENEYVKDVQKLIQNSFELSTSIRKSKISNCQSINCSSSLLSISMGKLMGIGAHDKKVPDCIWQSNNEEIIKSFLEGLIKGDGCYKSDTISLCTVSETLARQVRMLFARIGIKSSIRSVINKPSKLVKCEVLSFNVECYGQYARVAHKFINKNDQLLSRKSDNPKWIDKGTVGWIESDYIVVPIHRIRRKEYHGQVYNLEVEKDNSYVTGFSVHNCAIRDWWMDEFVLRSPVRQNFSFIWLATIDGEPQRELWLDSYKQADCILTYSEYGMNLLKKTARRGTNLVTIASPGSDLETFKPPENKREHKAKLGIDPDSLIIGTVMRNQKRKLYYDLIEAFSKWLNMSKNKGHVALAKKTFLYLHTSYPDVGYDIGKAIRDFKVGNKVIMTYLCSNCQTVYPAFFSGEIMICRKCGKLAAHPPNANHSCPRNVLADIMKLFDLYVQYSICEGFGMPCIDAIACGVPVAAVDYSAMQDHLKCPTSISIDVERFFWEAIIETEQKRALPNNADFVNKLDRFVKYSESVRDDKSRQTRAYAEEVMDVYGCDIKLPRYSWERTAAIWGQVIREIKIKDQKTTWLCPNSRIYSPNLVAPSNDMNNSEFVNWVIGKVWNRPDMLNTHFAGDWLQCLNSGSRTSGDKRIPFDRKAFVEHFMNIINQGNVIETKRLSELRCDTTEQVSVTVI